MKFEILSRHHLKQLLDFELKNKSWFESLIEPRDIKFYSEKGVSQHIEMHIDNMNSGSAFCGVLVRNNTIVARGNLKDISSKEAFVGYRVSKQFVSQGLASFCLIELIKIAQNKFDIQVLKAQVLDNNPASKHILIKQGFEAVVNIPNFLTLNNKQLSCTEFSLKYT